MAKQVNFDEIVQPSGKRLGDCAADDLREASAYCTAQAEAEQKKIDEIEKEMLRRFPEGHA